MLNLETRERGTWRRFDPIDVEGAAREAGEAVKRTPLEPYRPGSSLRSVDSRIDLRLKLENRQHTGAFKARGAWNQVRQLGAAARAGGVVACSSGNHGQALAWAAGRAGVPATIVMPDDAYPNKIQGCRDFGAEVVLAPGRQAAEALAAERVAAGATLIHPYDAERTIAGAGTVGLEIAQEWPEVEVVVLPVGGGGLAAGSSLAIRRGLGEGVRIVAVEPAGAPNLARALEAGEPVVVDPITTRVQGLCPLVIGTLNHAVLQTTLDRSAWLEDEVIFGAQGDLVRWGETVEPAGAAATAFVLEAFPAEWLAGRGPEDPLRVCAVVSGGNPDPAQLAALRSSA